MTVSNKDFVRQISNRTGFAQSDIKKVVDAMYDVVVENVKECNEVKLMSGLSICGVIRDARIGRNPRTGESVNIPAKICCKAKIGEGIKNVIN